MTTETALLLNALKLSMERGGRQLFTDLSLKVAAGEVVQIEGSNGAGKTSLLRILAGLSRYGFSGRVECPSPLLYLGHQPGVKALLSPRENLAWHVSGDASYRSEQIESALAAVGLYGYEDLPSSMLSAGQLRRVNLARLYLPSAPLWLLDEPFTAIDKSGVAALESRMADHAQAGGAVVLSSHQQIQIAHPMRTITLDSGHSKGE